MLASCFTALFDRPFDDEQFDTWFNGRRTYSIKALAIFTQHTCSDNNSLKNLTVKGLKHTSAFERQVGQCIFQIAPS